MRWFSHFICWFRTGHERIQVFVRKGWWLECVNCGHQTPGIQIHPRGPRKRYDGIKARHQIKRSA